MSPRFYNVLWTAALIASVILVLLLSGCQHPLPAAIALPTTAAIRAPLAAAQAHVARAAVIGKQEQALAQRAAARGIAAGSEEARELSTLTLAHAQADAGAQDQLTAALYQAGTLDRQLQEKEKQYAALYRDDSAKTAKIVVIEHHLHRWQLALLILFVADFFAGGVIQGALQSAAAAVARVAVAFCQHLVAFWPLLLAAL